MAALLYEVATGKPAFSGPIDQLIKDIGNRRPVPLRVLREDAPEEFADAIETALSPDRERRITSIDELATRVRGALGVVSELTPVPPPPRKKPSPPPVNSASDTAADLPSSRRRREKVVRRAWVKGALVGGVIAAVGVAAMFAVWGMSGDDDSDAPPPAAPQAAMASQPATPAQAAPTPPPVAVVTPDAAPVPTAVSLSVPVRVRSRPPNAAVVSVHGETLGFTPLVVEVFPDRPLGLILRRDGFEDMTVSVDGSAPSVTYQLVRVSLEELCRRDPTRIECGLE
jgi:hypothetical protein